MRVSFGISNAHYALIDPITGAYKTPIALPGAVSLAISGGDKELTVKSYYGDVPFGTEKGGYSGSLVIASLPLAFLSDVFGIEIDNNGAEIDRGVKEIRHFALMYQTSTDEGKIREVYYNCTADKPQYSIRTNDTGITVATRRMNIVMRQNPARLIRGYDDPYRARITSDKAAYDTFFERVYGA